MIVGIVGFISSGKGAVGDILEKRYGFYKESFAKALKDACSVVFGWDREMLEGATKESREWRETVDPYWANVLNKPNFTPRLALQWMGTEAGRNVFGEDIWTAGCIKRCTTGDNYVITDVRFRNEIKAIRDVGGYIFRVKRGYDPFWFDGLAAMPEEYRTEYMTANAPDLHISEWDWIGDNNVDYIIENDGTLEDLEDNVINTLRKTHNHEAIK